VLLSMTLTRVQNEQSTKNVAVAVLGQSLIRLRRPLSYFCYYRTCDTGFLRDYNGDMVQ
jgi:hypothetical protein